MIFLKFFYDILQISIIMLLNQTLIKFFNPMSKKFTNKLTIYFFEYLNNIIQYIIISVFVVCAVIPGPGVIVGMAIGIIIGVLKTKYKIKNGIFSSQHIFVKTLSNLIKFGF